MNEAPIPADGSTITLRPVRPDDELFLRAAYASTREEELGRTGLDDAQKEAFLDMQFRAQQQDYRGRFPDAEHSIILHGDERVGRLYVARSDDEVRVLDLTVLPEYRNGGIGTGLVKDLVREASESHRPVRIHLDYGSPSIRLFERLGFTPVEEQPFTALFEWRTS